MIGGCIALSTAAVAVAARENMSAVSALRHAAVVAADERPSDASSRWPTLRAPKFRPRGNRLLTLMVLSGDDKSPAQVWGYQAPVPRWSCKEQDKNLFFYRCIKNTSRDSRVGPRELL